MPQSNMKDGDYISALECRKRVQEYEKDQRDDAREAEHFITDRFGQWESDVIRKWSNRPKYQLDRTSSVVDRISGEIEQLEFGGAVIPFDSSATEDIAKTYQGMIRTIDNMSNAASIYQAAARRIITSGFAAWRIKTAWADVDAFEQDILIEPIVNAVDRVWIDGSGYAVSPKDIKRAYVDTFLSPQEYKAAFPDGSAQSVGEQRTGSYYNNTPEGIWVTDYYYIKEEPKKIHLMSNGKVYDDEKYRLVFEDLTKKGVSVIKSRVRKVPVAYMRKLDAGGWLTDEFKLPFSYIPVIGCYANKSTIENKIQYYGEVKRLMDPQRIYNYSVSREIAEGALAPVRKIARTIKQGEGLEAQSRKLNTSNDPEYVYHPDEKAPPPYEIGGPQPNAQLTNTANRAAQDIEAISQSFEPVRGEGISGHSGKAYEILTQNSNTSSFKYVKALKESIQWTYEIIVDAIPRVYDTKARQMRITNSDGSGKFVQINEELRRPNGVEVVNDLSQGRYMFEVMSGPGYTTKANETVEVLSKWAALDPTLVSEGADILYGSMQQEGMSQLAERKRKSMVDQGLIPDSQLTDEERQKIIKQIEAQDNQPPSPMDQATVAVLMAQVQDMQAQTEERMNRMHIDILEQQRKMMETLMKAQKQEADIQKVQSETLENLRVATGADAIISGNVASAYSEVAEDIASGTPGLRELPN